MANTILTSKQIATRALAALVDSAVLSSKIHRDYENTFVRGVGQTISVRKPATFVADDFDRATGIVLQDATEGEIDVTLDQHPDVSFAVTDHELTMDIADFDAQFLTPATDAIITHVETSIAGLRADITQTVGDGTSANPYTDPKVLADAAAVLTAKRVPFTDRHAFVGPALYAGYITQPPFDKADSSASTDALREARLGRAYGFETWQTPTYAATSPATEDALAFHKDAFALVTRPLWSPNQAGVEAAYVSHEGFSLRVVKGYDMTKKRLVVSVDMLYGVKTIDPDRAVLISAGA